MLIPAFNPETDDLERSFLATNYSAGAMLISVKNTDRFAANDRIMIGEMGQEKTEIVTVSAPAGNGTDLIIGATTFAHSSDDPVYKLRFDTVRYYRSTTGSTGVFTLVSTQALDVDNEDLETKYDDTSGLTTYYYYCTFYHSISTLESANSDIIGGAGWRREQVGKIIDEILQEVSDKNEEHITRSEVLSFFNDVNDDLTIDNSKPPEFLKTELLINRVAGQNYVPYPTDSNSKQIMWKFWSMDYRFTDPTTSPVTDKTSTIEVTDLEDFRNRFSDNTNNATTQSDAKPDFMCLNNFSNRFLFSQHFLTSATSALVLHYWKFFNVIDSEGDIIETPTPKIYKLYGKAMYYRKRSVTESSYSSLASEYNSEYQLERTKYRSHNRKDKGTPRQFHPKTSTHQRYRR